MLPERVYGISLRRIAMLDGLTRWLQNCLCQIINWPFLHKYGAGPTAENPCFDSVARLNAYF